MTLVVKFGGTSVGSANAMRSTADLILTYQNTFGNTVVVASGMGSKPIKVTDLLLNGANSAAAGDPVLYQENAAAMQDIHAAAINDLIADETTRAEVIAENGQFIQRYTDLCRAVNILGELSPRALDAIGGMGEQMSVRILAAYMRESGHDAEAIDATELIVTDDNFGDAAPDFEATREKARARIVPILERGGIPIVTGFIGATPEGITTTLGRGGSDYTGAILGNLLDADEVWIWTDVDGVMTADPRIVLNARSIPELSFREISELAYYGAKVVHPKTMRPCVAGGIPLRIKNTFNPNNPGTVIVEQASKDGTAIKGVTAVRDVRLITVEGTGMMGVPGVAARTFGAVARESVSILLITQSSSEQSICFATSAGTTQRTLNALEAEFAKELENHDIERIWAMNPVAIVTIVGAGMRGTSGIAGGAFSALSSINIIAIAQGSSECSISLVVDDEDATEAVKLLHGLIVGT